MTASEQNEAIAKWMGRTVPCLDDAHQWKRLKMAESIARLAPSAWVDKCTVCHAVRTHETRHPSQYHWGKEHAIPNYTGDLNACFDFEEKLRNDGSGAWEHYARILGYRAGTTYGDVWELVHATAARRAEALLKTLSLWEGGE